MYSPRFLSRLLFVVCAVLAQGAGWAQESALHLLTEPASTFMKDGVPVGPATDRLREMMVRAHITADIEIVPWARAYNSALTQAGSCAYSTTRTAEREPLFKWVGPIASTEWILFGLRERGFKLASLDDARPYLIGTYLDDVRDVYLRERGFRVASVTDDVSNPKKLLVGRIDLWAASRRKMQTIIAPNGWQNKIVPVLRFNRVDLYLACNRQVSDTVMASLDAALAAMNRDGSAKAIDDKYENWVQH